MQSFDQTETKRKPLSSNPADWPPAMREAIAILAAAFRGFYDRQEKPVTEEVKK